MIALNNRTYRLVLSETGLPLVVVRQSRLIWRVASARDTANVLAGLTLRVVS